MGKQYETDVVMRNLWLHLVRDFRTVLGHEYNLGVEKSFLEGIIAYRAYKWPARCQAPPYLFKCEAQLEMLFKRYRFKHDVFSDDELLLNSWNKFQATQQRISSVRFESGILFQVLQTARKIVKRILRDYDPEEHMSLCRFGKRACAGSPYSRSYLDLKFGKSLTGSQEHIGWFSKEYLPTDRILESVIEQCIPKGKPIYKVCDTLTLTFVPKSYKALRSVKPPTLIGSFYTYGLGKVIQSRLAEEGLDIRRLQDKHRRMIKPMSKHRRSVTADLSSASDSLTWTLLCKILPRPWLHAVMRGFTPYVKYDGRTTRIFSVATMGDGHTFPLQTLVFYALLRAIEQLEGSSTHAVISVYGDDLIYPTYLHKYVKGIFPGLGLILNGDKTYVQDYFRESCGSDYYRGCDVRPFSPEGGHSQLSPILFRAWLHQLYNGLLERWHTEEIEGTLQYLRSLLAQFGPILQCPPSFPEYAGVRVRIPRNTDEWSKTAFHVKTWKWHFSYLRFSSDLRAVKSQYPYYWENLRSCSFEEHSDTWDKPVDQPILRWVRSKKRKDIIRSSNGTRFKRLIPMIAKKSSIRVRSEMGSTSCWI